MMLAFRRHWCAAGGEAMDRHYTAITPELYDYVLEHRSDRDDPVARALVEETVALGPVSMMQASREHGTLMTLLARAIGARSAIEVGTFTGYTALCIARGLVEGGRLLCCDLNEEWTSIGRRHWQRAGMASRIDLRLGPALDTLRALPAGTEFDFAFIDADKTGYRDYYEEILERMRPNGLILFDNVLWMGLVLDATTSDADTRALRALNDFLVGDRRVESVMLPISDGVTIVRKRAPGERS
jgi:caffeoyl-CoA O-methyltransferase